MRILVTIIAISAFLLTACSEPGAGISESPADEQSKWKVKNVDAVTAQKLIQENLQVAVLDIRTPEEFAEGHIKGALNVDFKAADFAQQVTKLDKNKAYVVHCRSGGRSRKSLSIFKDNNFGTIYHLDKGFNDWKAAGNPTVR